jgi:hypothetical protein
MAKELRSKDEWNGAFNRGETKIEWEVKGNPKRSGFKAHARFEQYFGAETVAQYLEKGGTKGDLRYDWENKFLSLQVPPEAPEVAESASAKAEIAESADTKTEAKKSKKASPSREASKEAVDAELLS